MVGFIFLPIRHRSFCIFTSEQRGITSEHHWNTDILLINFSENNVFYTQFCSNFPQGKLICFCLKQTRSQQKELFLLQKFLPKKLNNMFHFVFRGTWTQMSNKLYTTSQSCAAWRNTADGNQENTTKLNAPNKILKCEDQRELRHFFVLEGH